MLIAVSVFFLSRRTVEVIYFASEECKLTGSSDEIIEDVKRTFGDKVEVREFMINLEFPEEDSYEVRILREEYSVYGVPTIIVNGKESNLDDVKINICRNFIIKPGGCKGV